MSAEGSRRKRKTNYMLMLFMDSKEGRIRQMGFGPHLVESVVIIGLAVVVVLSVICYRSDKKIEVLMAETEQQKRSIEELTEEKADLVSLREELMNKVTILSDTINQKVEEEEALEQERAQAHMPVGFPLSSSASLEEDDGENPMVKLSGSEGSSVIASADGTIISITTDSGYLHCIKIDHGNGYNSIYRNDGDVMVREGDEVVRGAILYVIGEDNTELGYQIMYEEKYIDPMGLINIDG
ncbi:MAG: M23 family metallopeptidase [Lachnospiraceae bacterium]|nr:M23 family metallopeptidase [Lachnospiraceae bacterium]